MKWLLGELTGKRPLLPPTLHTSAEQADVLNTFRVIAQLPPDSLGAYVISMARSASDVLAVVLLQVHTVASPLSLLPTVGHGPGYESREQHALQTCCCYACM